VFNGTPWIVGFQSPNLISAVFAADAMVKETNSAGISIFIGFPLGRGVKWRTAEDRTKSLSRHNH
jgi:hypothetical protein